MWIKLDIKFTGMSSRTNAKVLPGDAVIMEYPSGEPVSVRVSSGLLEAPGCVLARGKLTRLTNSPTLLFSTSNSTYIDVQLTQKQKDAWNWTVPFPYGELKTLFYNIFSIAQTGLVPLVGIAGRVSSGRKTILYTLAGWLTRAGVSVIVADFDPSGTAVGYPGTISAAQFLLGETPGAMLGMWGVCSFCNSRKALNYLTTMIQDRVFSLLTNHEVRGLSQPVVVLYRAPSYLNTTEGRRNLHLQLNRIWSFLDDKIYRYTLPVSNVSSGAVNTSLAHFTKFTNEITGELSGLPYREAIGAIGKYLPLIIATSNSTQLNPMTISRPASGDVSGAVNVPVLLVDLKVDPLLQDATPVALIQRRRIHEYFYGFEGRLAPMILRFRYTNRVENTLSDTSQGEKHEFCSIIQMMCDDETDYARILTIRDFIGETPMNLKERVCYMPRFHDEDQGAEILEQLDEGKLSEFFESTEGAIVLLNANIIGLAVIKDYEVRDDTLYVEVLMPTSIIVSEIMILLLTEHFAGGSA